MLQPSDLTEGDTITRDGLLMLEVLDADAENRVGESGVTVQERDADDPDEHFFTDTQIRVYFERPIVAELKEATDGHSMEPL